MPLTLQQRLRQSQVDANMGAIKTLWKCQAATKGALGHLAWTTLGARTHTRAYQALAATLAACRIGAATGGALVP